MKKVLDGSVYDTEKATCIGEYDNGHMPNDFDYYEEQLYRTKSGKFFLYGEGGGNSRYGEWHGNSGGPGMKIMPMSFDEARRWAEKYLSGEDYIEAFGEPEEGEKSLKGIYLSPAAARRLEQMQAEKGITQSAIVEALIMGE